MDPDLENKTSDVPQQPSLLAANLLTTVVSSYFSAHPTCLCRPRLHYPGTGSKISPEPSAQELVDRPGHPLLGAVETPLSEVVIDGVPRRKVAGQELPGTATPQVVEDGVRDYAGAVDFELSSPYRIRKVGLDVLPFSAGEIGREAPFRVQERTSRPT
jgi:hypothetical protein